MPSIQVTDHTFRRLQALAVPFVDSPEDVIVRLLDNPITPEEPKPPRARPAGTKEYDPFSPPPLTHTKLLRAVINGRSINPPRWNNLMDETLRECIRAGDAADVIRRSPVNVVLGHRED